MIFQRTLLLSATICFLWISSCQISQSSAQNVDALCRQVYTDCQACNVFEKECRRPSHPKPSTGRPQHPQTKPTPAPTWPPQQTPAPTWPPQQTPAPTWPPQQNQQPGYPESPETLPPQPVPTHPPHNCVQYGQWCKSNEECCTKNCQLELVTLGDPNHHYTQRVCR